MERDVTWNFSLGYMTEIHFVDPLKSSQHVWSSSGVDIFLLGMGSEPEFLTAFLSSCHVIKVIFLETKLLTGLHKFFVVSSTNF